VSSVSTGLLSEILAVSGGQVLSNLFDKFVNQFHSILPNFVISFQRETMVSSNPGAKRAKHLQPLRADMNTGAAAPFQPARLIHKPWLPSAQERVQRTLITFHPFLKARHTEYPYCSSCNRQ
jgi:hypothetical protein